MKEEVFGEVAGRFRWAELGADVHVGEMEREAEELGTNCIDWEEERLKKGMEVGASLFEVSRFVENEGLEAFSPPVIVWYK